MIWKISLICTVLLIALCTVTAGAVDLPKTEIKYITVSLDEYSTLKAAPVTGTIRQGETCVHTYQVPSGKSKLEVHLEWTAGTANDLSLRICDPDQQTLGPYNDQFDGRSDHNIRVGVSKNPLPTGQWRVEIYGSLANGDETFTGTLNAI